MLKRAEYSLGGTRCGLRGEGDGFRRCLGLCGGSETEAGHANEGAGAKRLAQAVE